MKILNIRDGKALLKNIKILGILAGVVFLCVRCESLDTFTNEEVVYNADYDLSISKYFESRKDSTPSFSILADIMDETGLVHLFRTYGDYTFLAPTDEAFEEFFASQGKSSYKDYSVEELTKLIKYHIFQVEYLAGSFNSGIIETETMNNRYMVSTPTADGTDFLFNKSARMVRKDELLPNGIVHVIDHVLQYPQESIYDWVKGNTDKYSIFVEALEQTGLSEKFDLLGDSTEIFYSCFVTPDDKYIESNVNSFADLAKIISPDDNNYTDTNNLMYSFIASHFTEDIVSMSDASEDHAYFGTVGGASIKFGLRPNSADIVLDYYTSDFPNGLDVNEFESNNLAGNGIIHIMDTMYQVPEKFARTKLLYWYLDVPGLPYDSLYDVHVKKVEEGTWEDAVDRYWPPTTISNHVPFEKTNGWLTLNAPYAGGLKFDDHSYTMRGGSYDYLNGEGMGISFNFTPCDDLMDITRKLPYIIPGKYKLILVTKLGTERPSVEHYWDGERVGGIVNLAQGTGVSWHAVELGIIEIHEGEAEHYFREKMVTTGNGFHVAIRLDPVE